MKTVLISPGNPEKPRQTRVRKRTLYDCSHAKVFKRTVYCDKGYPLMVKGSLDIWLLAKGKPLTMAVCQLCNDFDRLGRPLPQEEKGWIRRVPIANRDNERSDDIN